MPGLEKLAGAITDMRGELLRAAWLDGCRTGALVTAVVLIVLWIFFGRK